MGVQAFASQAPSPTAATSDRIVELFKVWCYQHKGNSIPLVRKKCLDYYLTKSMVMSKKLVFGKDIKYDMRSLKITIFF